MKDLSEFLALTTEEQFDFVWHHCKHLASREEENLLVSLYYGEGLLVEVWFDEAWNLVRIRPFTQYKPNRMRLGNGVLSMLVH